MPPSSIARPLTARSARTARLRSLAVLLAALVACACAMLICAPQTALARTYLSTDGNAISADEAEPQNASVADEADVKQYDPMAVGLADGTYVGSGEGFKSLVTVSVEVRDQKIVSIEVTSEGDDEEYFDWASGVIPKIVEYQSSEVDGITGATYSSRGIKAAVTDALTGEGSQNQLLAQVTVASGWVMRIIAVVGAILAVVFTVKRRRAASARERLAAGARQRLALQATFFALVPAVFASSLMGIKAPLSQIAVGTSPSLTTFTLLLVATIAFTALFGRYFCGYVCSFGFMQDLAWRLSGFVLRKAKIKRRTLPRAATRVLGYFKYLVLAALCVGVLLGASQAINQNSPWTAFARLTSFTVIGITAASAILLAIAFIGSLFEKRFFCRFACPLGAVYSIVPTVKRTGRVFWNRPECFKGCDACRANCPVDINPRGKLLAGECLGCAQCADVCPAHNITVGFQRTPDDGVGKGKGGRLSWLRDPSTALLAKGVVLLAIFWLLGIVRFLPKPPF